MQKNNSEIQKKKIKEFISSKNSNEIFHAIDNLPLSVREQIVLKALIYRELIRGKNGSTAKEILFEIQKNKGSKGPKIGVRIWTILNDLSNRRFIQTIKGFPKQYILNKELNPMHQIMYSYSLLENMYDVLPELEKQTQNITKHTLVSSYGVYSNNNEYLEILIDMMNLAKKEIISTTRVCQSLDEFPSFVYVLGKAIEREVKIHFLITDEAPTVRLNLLKEVGVSFKIVKESVLLQYNIPNITITDKRHFMMVNKYEYQSGQKIRFGFWHKNNPKICLNYHKAFWEVWNLS